MNYGSILGVIGALIVFWGSVFLTIDDTSVLMDHVAIIMVFGGTVTAGLICFPLSELIKVLKLVGKRILGKSTLDYASVVRQIVALSKAFRQSSSAYEAEIARTSEPFLKDAAQVLFWVEAEVTPDKLRHLLENRAETFFAASMNEAKIFRTLSKFPPSFGLMGTTIGLIALLQSLGSPESQKNIGPSMAVALITTLYGLVVANFVLVPIAENLTKQTEDDHVLRTMIVEGVMLIQEREPTKYVEESVKSFLLPHQRGESTEGKKAA